MISYFLGANSPHGFYSLYDELIDPETAEAVYILKGGAGCGKSTFLHRIASAAEAAGHPVEYIRCSGDPDSLDAVVLPDQNTALVDGTAPHVVEPRLPGVVDHYINLEVCYDSAALRPMREAIAGAMTGYQDCYDRAYRCLAAAAEIEADRRSLLEGGPLDAKIARRLKGILAREFRQAGGGSGKATRRFLSAVTCQGHICQWESVQDSCRKIYELEDSCGLSHRLLAPLLSAALALGHDAVVCPSPMDPERIEHLLFPALGLAFVTSSPELPFPGKALRKIRLDAMADPDLLRRNRPRLRFGKKVSEALVEEAVASLREAKAMHDRLEALYNPHVDFALGNAMAEELIRTLEL